MHLSGKAKLLPANGGQLPEALLSQEWEVEQEYDILYLSDGNGQRYSLHLSTCMIVWSDIPTIIPPDKEEGE